MLLSVVVKIATVCIPLVTQIISDPADPSVCRNRHWEPTYADGVIIPPAKYDHQPTVPWFIEIVDRKTITTVCDTTAAACTYPPSKDEPFCLTFLQKSYEDEQSPTEIYFHERAHCNGWWHSLDPFVYSREQLIKWTNHHVGHQAHSE